MPLTASGHEQLASAKLLLANTQGFMYLPVLVPHEVAGEAVLSELKVANEAGGFAWLVVDWPTLPSAFDQPPSRTEIAEARQRLLSSIDAIIVADTSSPRAIVLDASPSTRHVLAQDVIVYLNQRRQLLRAGALRLIVVWPLALREDLVGGAPDLWSVRAISPSLFVSDVVLPKLQDLVSRAQLFINQPQEIIFDTAAQERKYALWKATGSLEAADLSPSELLGLLSVLQRHHHGQEMLELVRAGRVRTIGESFVAALAGFSGTAFAELGRFGDALEATREAVAIFRRLWQTHPGAHESNLATSINNLANRLSATGDSAGALVAAREAVAIRRRQTQVNPAVHEPDLGMTVSNLANRLSEMGENSAALDAAREAVAIRRRLALANPAANEPDLAASIINLGRILIETGDRAGALEAAREAVTIGRRLVQANVAAYEPNFAKSLIVLAHALSADGQTKLASEAATEAATRLRPWAAQFPEAYDELLGVAEALVAKLSGT